MKIVIAGSRSIENYAALLRAIESSAFEISEVVCGEGCVSYVSIGGYLTPDLRVGQKDVRVLLAFQELFGGSIQTFSTCHMWVVASTKAVEVCKLLLPYSVGKKAQLELLISSWEQNFTGKGNQRTEAQELALALASVQLSRLKQDIVTLKDIEAAANAE